MSLRDSVSVFSKKSDPNKRSGVSSKLKQAEASAATYNTLLPSSCTNSRAVSYKRGRLSIATSQKPSRITIGAGTPGQRTGAGS